MLAKFIPFARSVSLLLALLRPILAGDDGGLHYLHLNTIHRAGRNTQLAAGAFLLDHGMHVFSRTQDGVHWAGVDAQCATDAYRLVDHGPRFRFRYAMFGIQGFGIDAQQFGQPGHSFVATGWALIDVSITFGNRDGVWLAGGVAALTALCLRQNRIDFFYERIHGGGVKAGLKRGQECFRRVVRQTEIFGDTRVRDVPTIQLQALAQTGMIAQGGVRLRRQL